MRPAIWLRHLCFALLRQVSGQNYLHLVLLHEVKMCDRSCAVRLPLSHASKHRNFMETARANPMKKVRSMLLPVAKELSDICSSHYHNAAVAAFLNPGQVANSFVAVQAVFCEGFGSFS